MKRAPVMVVLVGMAVVAALFLRADDQALARSKRLPGLRAELARLGPTNVALPKPEPGDWLFLHDEPGQTFEQFLACGPTLPTDTRRTICLVTIGETPKEHARVIETAGKYLGVVFGLPVRAEPALPVSVVEARFRRRNSFTQAEQWRCDHILDNVLAPRLPRDATALLALTSTDLYPSDDWNFVFGMASLQKRVGVYSLARFGDPAKGGEEAKLCLRRTLMVAAHETGHMFSLKHCKHGPCCMNGSNSLAESDRSTLAFCPECLVKLGHLSGTSAGGRLKAMSDFLRPLGFDKDVARIDAQMAALQAGPGGPAGTNP